MLELGHRRADLNVRSEAVLDEVVLFLTEGIVLVLLLNKLRTLLMAGEIRSSLLHKPTAEHVLVVVDDLLMVWVERVLNMLGWWLRDVLHMMRRCLLNVLRLLIVLRNVFLVQSEVWWWTLTWRELLLVGELRTVELWNRAVVRRQLLTGDVEVWWCPLARRQVLALRSLNAWLSLLEVLRREVLRRSLELRLLLWLVRESY